MLKRLFIITALLLLGCGLYAQSYSTPNDTIHGANGAKTIILGKATAGYPEYLTQNGRYISGVYGGAAGYVYDFEQDTCIIFMESTLAGYFSENHYAGQNDPGDTYAESYVYYNGKKIPLEKVLNDDSKASWKEVSIFAVQDNGDKLATMVYNSWLQADGNLNHYNRAAIHDGKTGKCLIQLPFAWSPDSILVDVDKIGFGSRADCISADGAIVGGHSTNPNAFSNWSLAFWDISDPNDIKTFGLEGKAFDFGSFYGASSDGSLLAGAAETRGYGVIVHYNRQQKKIDKIDTLSPLPSWDFLAFSDIADNGMAIGYCGMTVDPATREAIVYTELTGVVKMTDFLYEYYDIDIRKGIDLYTPMRITRDGKRIIGFNFESPTVPYAHELSDIRILPRARKISARAARGKEEAYITWQAPLTSEHVLTGYNIYRDDEEQPLNTTVLPVSTTTYPDYTVKAGKHTYYIEAIYNDGPAMKQASNQVQVVEEGVSFPVQAINHRVDYNRFAHIYWSVPSSEVVALAKNDIVTPNTEPKGKFEHVFEKAEMNETETSAKEAVNALRPKSYTSTTLDYIANVNMLTYSGRAAVKIGDYYYTTSHLGGGITVIDQFNEPVKTIHPANLGIVSSMVYLEDENLLYCGTSKGRINVLDLSTEEIVDEFEVQAAAFLAYVPDMKDGKPGLVAGGPHSCHTYLWNEEDHDYELYQENFLNFGPLYAMGATYYKGRLYVGSASGPYYNEVYIYNFATREQIDEPIQVVEDPAMYNLLTLNGNEYLLAAMSTICQPGSLSVCKLEDGTTALGMVFQCNYMTSRFMLLELESAEAVKGYDLYRSVDGGTPAVVNKTPLTSRRYTESLDKVGKYTYYVVVKSENNKNDSEKSPVDTLTISDQGTCPKADFTIKESNSWPVLEWMPNKSDMALVGFDLYRDGQHIERFWLNDMRVDYIDEAVTKLGTYNYRLETLYEEGCVAVSEASITLTGEGFAQAPFGVSASHKLNNDLATYTVTTKWETPMFEEPLVLGYCNGGLQAEAIGFDNFYECIGLIGWRKSDLDLYRDLYLVGMEYMVGAVPDVYEALVYIDDERAYKQTIKQISPRSWRTVMFDKSFSMNQKEEVAVGFYTKYSAESLGVLAVDPTVTKNGKSNILSLDNGDHWSTLQAGGVSGSWLINALVVHKRDLAAAKNADGSINHDKLAGSIIRLAMEGKPLNAQKATIPNATFDVKPSAKAPLQLTGFNVYRKVADGDGSVKLNDAPLTTFELTDAGVKPGEYDYEVAAVYADGKEVKASVFVELPDLEANENADEVLKLNVYPNPATEWINVEGEYETLQIFDFGGRLLRTVPAATQIQLGDLNPGTYFLHFMGADARKAVYKIVIR